MAVRRNWQRPTERNRIARWMLMALPVSADAEAEPRPINAYARPAIVTAIVVVIVSRSCIVTVSDDRATPGIPASAGVVTDYPCLMKEGGTASGLNFVGRVCVRGYECTGAGEQCHCQFSHVHLLISRGT